MKRLAKGLHGDTACHTRIVEGKSRVFTNISQENIRRTDYLRSSLLGILELDPFLEVRSQSGAARG